MCELVSFINRLTCLFKLRWKIHPCTHRLICILSSHFLFFGGGVQLSTQCKPILHENLFFFTLLSKTIFVFVGVFFLFVYIGIALFLVMFSFTEREKKDWKWCCSYDRPVWGAVTKSLNTPETGNKTWNRRYPRIWCTLSKLKRKIKTDQHFLK